MKFKRTISNCDTWSTREQLCLASSVLKSGDQNWISVSRSLKPFVEKEPLRPTDWFSPKLCAIQYACLLENADTPKRKKRESGETTGESIVRKLTQERVTELSQMLNRQREEYLRLKADLNHFKSSAISDEKLEKMWLDIQQEEREMEQKTRTHMAWLAKRQQQQKQDMSSPSISTSIVTQTRKAVESTTEVLQESTATESSTENDEEKKTNRGGRSPLLTSLLKSPSPTTQTAQSFPSTPVQVSSPTITSLLGSSPKALNAQMAQKVSPQLQQLVSTAIASANTTPERPSVGAPTLSMLLEMPASTQRGSLPNLQTTTPTTNVSHAQQQQTTTTVAATSQVHNFQQAAQSQTQVQQAIQNEAMAATMSTVPATVTTSTNMPVSENMQMQIIDHIDVIRKDIMVDVMDKDEINDIIGDIEELIKEEIKEDIPSSPQTIDTSGSTTTATTTAVINSLTSMSQQATEVLIPTTGPRPQPRDVDEAVSLSDSPQSEMAIEEIDSSTSNIAEIIGTVAIDSQEPKIIVTEITETIPNTSETKSETSTCEKRTTLTEQLVPKTEIKDEETSNDIPMEEKQSDAETKSMDASSNVEIEKNNSKLLGDTKETINETTEDVEEEAEEEEEEETEVTAPVYKESSDSVKERKEPPEDIEGKHNAGLDQLEIYLAKITGDQQDVPSAEIVSISSEVTNDLPSAEDTEKSQDISLILEDDESSQSTESKKKEEKMTEERIVENMVENTESLESFKEESIKEKNVVEIKEESSIKSQTEETNEETLEIGTELKKEKIKDSSEDATSSILQDVEVKEEEADKGPTDENEDTKQVTIEEAKSVKSEPVEATTAEAEIHIKKTESAEVKSEESKIETEPEVSDLFHRKSPLHSSSEEDKKEKMEVKEKKEEKDDVTKTTEGEQSIKKEVESTIVEEPGELDEEESSLSKLSSNRAMKTYSKKQNIAVDSEPENESTGEGADYRAWKKAVMLVYNRLATHKYASVFLRPITEDQAPGYHSVIFRPMDLSTIKKNIDNGTIRSTMHFQRDVMLMFQNAIMYNKHDTFIFKMAVSMQEECLQHMQARKRFYLLFITLIQIIYSFLLMTADILVQATGEGTFRRETRTAASSSSETNENSLKRKRSHITPSPHDTDTPRSKKRRKSEND
ncbi:BRD8 protein, partial [Acromyrmex heyeri]